jgi:protein required for attachment to host cells
MLLAHGTLVLVVDGGGLRLLRNSGREAAVDLELVADRTFRNPPAHMLDEDRPGRAFESSGPTRHAYEGPDHHRLREQHFAQEAGELLDASIGEGTPVIAIAPPRMLGELRAHWSARIREHLVAEIDKDLSHLSRIEIAEYLRDAR